MKKLLPFMLLAVALPLHADTLTVLGGVTNPLTRLSLDLPEQEDVLMGETGPGVGVQYLHTLARHAKWSVGGEVLHHAFGAHSEEIYPINRFGDDSEFRLKTTTFLLTVRRDFGSGSGVSPFLSFGLGAAHTTFVWDIDYGRVKDDFIKGSDTVIAGALGIGLDWTLRNGLVLGFEGRLTRTGDGRFGDPDHYWGSVDGPLAAASAFLRCGYRFGKIAAEDAPIRE
jgi:opacity protein-like surface antigen